MKNTLAQDILRNAQAACLLRFNLLVAFLHFHTCPCTEFAVFLEFFVIAFPIPWFSCVVYARRIKKPWRHKSLLRLISSSSPLKSDPVCQLPWMPSSFLVPHLKGPLDTCWSVARNASFLVVSKTQCCNRSDAGDSRMLNKQLLHALQDWVRSYLSNDALQFVACEDGPRQVWQVASILFEAPCLFIDLPVAQRTHLPFQRFIEL